MRKDLTALVPAHAKDLEEAVLGALLLVRDAVQVVLPVLRVDDFYIPNHQLIYNAIVTAFTQNSAIDLHTISDRLRRIKARSESEDIKSQLDVIGGPFTLVKLTNNVVSSAHILEHSLIIKQYSIKRQINTLAGKVYYQSLDDSVDALDLLAKLNAGVNTLTNQVQIHKSGSISNAITQTIENMHAAAATESHVIGIPCGIDSIDRQTLGFNAPDFIILSAGTGEGKSTLALQMAMNISKAGTPAGFVSLEMKAFQLCLKMFSMETGIDIQTLRKGALDMAQWEMLMQKVDSLMNLKFQYIDQGGLSIFDLRAIIHGWVNTFGVKVVFIDYIQLVNAAGGKMNFGTREQEVNFVSKQVKAICMELDICIIALSQMSRQEKGKPRKPVRSDLRESGALEQDSDAIMFIWRPVYNGITQDEHGKQYSKEDTLLLIEKYRLGRTGAIRLSFLGGQSKFTDYVKEDTSLPSDQKWVSIDSFEQGFNDDDLI